MDKEEFEKVWAELFKHFGCIWVRGDNFSIRANGYEFKIKLNEVYLYWNKELIAILNFKDVKWLA